MAERLVEHLVAIKAGLREANLAVWWAVRWVHLWVDLKAASKAVQWVAMSAVQKADRRAVW